MAPSTFWRRGAAVAFTAALLVPLSAAADPNGTDLGRASDYVQAQDQVSRWATTGKWFVEFESEPLSTGGSRTVIARQHRAFEDNARSAGVAPEVTATYENLFNGVAVNADSQTMETLADLPGVKNVFPVLPVSIPEAQDNTPQMLTAIAQTGADIAQSELGLDGTGIKVAILDTGIDIDHPDLGGNGTPGGMSFPTQRVAYGWDFVGDDYNADPTSDNYNPVPQPDANPDDCQGHGTHVAGIVGGSGTFTGVAPNVTFGAYRVFGCEGSTDTQIILDALEMAEADGMDVVNMSLGAGFESWPQYPTALASDRLVRNGVTVVASAGNEGDFFTQATGAPSVSNSAISVASYDNSHVRLDEVVFTTAGEPISTGYMPATGSPEMDEAVNGLEVVATTDPLGCAAETEDLTGKIAVIQRGTCTFHEKAVTAQNAGAAGLIIWNNAPGYVNATVEGETEITIPVITITQDAGAAIVAAPCTRLTT